MPIESNEQLLKRGTGISQILQSIEDALIDRGYDHYVVATDHGTFSWETVERARARDTGESNDDG